MKYKNKKGFFLIETIAACALLVAMSGIITMYIAAMGSQHRKANEQLQLFRMAQQAIYGNPAGTYKIAVETKPIIITTDLQSRGYSTRFHEKLVVKRVTPDNKNNQPLQLTAICVKDATA